MPPPIAALVGLLRSGRFVELARETEACTGRWPKSSAVWHLLGLARMELQRFTEAMAALAEASRLAPKDVDILEHLAAAQLQAGKKVEALRSFERCLAGRNGPAQLGPLINLASLANDLGRFGAAEGYSQRALRLSDDLAEIHFNLGRALRGLKRSDDAFASFRRALGLAGDSAVAHNDIGLQFLELELYGEAEVCFRRALALAPGFVKAEANLGRLLGASGRFEEGLGTLRAAVARNPEFAAAQVNLAVLLNSLGHHEEAERNARHALSIEPELPPALCVLGDALLGQRKRDGAEAIYRQALSIDPGFDTARNNLGNLLLDAGRYEEATRCYREMPSDDFSALGNAYYAAAQIADWSVRRDDEKRLLATLKNQQALATADVAVCPFSLLSLVDREATELQFRQARAYAENVFRASLSRKPLVASTGASARERLRVGYLSADFHEHATMHLLGGVLDAHDKQRFALYLYSYGPRADDAQRRRATAAAEVFRDIYGLSEVAAAETIASDNIDILVDLKGYTQDMRLAISALRPAPVIVSWLGYPGTLGHERLADYIIGDPVVTPEADAPHYSEALALMPWSYQPNDRAREIGPRLGRAEAGLPESASFVFCSFNQPFKLNPETMEVWCRLLASVPESVLWLLQPGNQLAADNLRREAQRRKVDPQRLVFAPRLPLREHLGRLQWADLALDTFPYGSHTTGSDALWAGVPLIARSGNTFSSRVAASLLRAVGLPELITSDWDAYFALARDLALDAPRLASLRAKLAELRMTAPLFDTARFTRDLERLYRKIWEQHCAGRRETIRLEPEGG